MAGLLGIEPLERTTIEAILDRAKHFQPEQNANFKRLDLLRGRIRAYNEATGGVNSDSAGYHETITRLYIVLIREFVRSADRGRPTDDLVRELIERIGDRRLPLRYYSRERLFSAEARLGWVEPDLLALPGVDVEN